MVGTLPIDRRYVEDPVRTGTSGRGLGQRLNPYRYRNLLRIPLSSVMTVCQGPPHRLDISCVRIRGVHRDQTRHELCGLTPTRGPSHAKRCQMSTSSPPSVATERSGGVSTEHPAI